MSFLLLMLLLFFNDDTNTPNAASKRTESTNTVCKQARPSIQFSSTTQQTYGTAVDDHDDYDNDNYNLHLGFFIYFYPSPTKREETDDVRSEHQYSDDIN